MSLGCKGDRWVERENWELPAFLQYLNSSNEMDGKREGQKEEERKRERENIDTM